MSERIALSPAARCAIEAHCRGAADHEVCGLLLGADGPVVSIDVALPLVNRSRRRDRFRAPADEVWQALRRERDDRRSLVGVYHSHPDGSIEPSRRDLEGAWGDLLQLIVGRSETGPRLAGWRLGPEGAVRVRLHEEAR